MYTVSTSVFLSVTILYGLILRELTSFKIDHWTLSASHEVFEIEFYRNKMVTSRNKGVKIWDFGAPWGYPLKGRLCVQNQYLPPGKISCRSVSLSPRNL